MGLFIVVEVNQAQPLSCQEIQQMVRVCPVNIFVEMSGRLGVDPEQEDECTLCQLCLEVGPPGAIRIRKLYSGQVLTRETKTHNRGVAPL